MQVKYLTSDPYLLGCVKRLKIEIELSALIGFGYDLSEIFQLYTQC